MLVLEILPKLHEEVRSEQLAQLVQEHLEQTRGHAQRVEEAFRAAGAEPSSNLDAATQRLAEQHDELAQKIVEERLADAFHAAAAIATEHRELAAYEAVIALAAALGLNASLKLLERNRDEEEQARKKLRKELTRLIEAAVEQK